MKVADSARQQYDYIQQGVEVDRITLMVHS